MALHGLISRPILELCFFIEVHFTTRYRKEVVRKSRYSKRKITYR